MFPDEKQRDEQRIPERCRCFSLLCAIPGLRDGNAVGFLFKIADLTSRLHVDRRHLISVEHIGLQYNDTLLVLSFYAAKSICVVYVNKRIDRQILDPDARGDIPGGNVHVDEVREILGRSAQNLRLRS